ncbi:MAG: ferrous iron transport protein A [Eubacteriales bacterium]
MKHETYSSCEDSLAALMPGQNALVVNIDPTSPLAIRLGDLGIAEGTRIRCERISLLGDPRAYRIFPGFMQTGEDEDFHEIVVGTVVALRYRDAVGIKVRRVPEHRKSRKPIRTVSSREAGVAWD